jgi:hypothetical protein
LVKIDVIISNNGGFKEWKYTQNGTLPGAGSNLLTTGLTCIRTAGIFRIDFVPSNAGVLEVTYTVGATTTTATLFGGATLTAGALYPAEILVNNTETINFQYTGTAAGTYRLVVREV